MESSRWLDHSFERKLVLAAEAEWSTKKVCVANVNAVLFCDTYTGARVGCCIRSCPFFQANHEGAPIRAQRRIFALARRASGHKTVSVAAQHWPTLVMSACRRDLKSDERIGA